MDASLTKRVIRNATSELDVYLHKIMLVAGREDRPAQCINYQLLNKVTVTVNYPVPVLEACIKRM